MPPHAHPDKPIADMTTTGGRVGKMERVNYEYSYEYLCIYVCTCALSMRSMPFGINSYFTYILVCTCACIYVGVLMYICAPACAVINFKDQKGVEWKICYKLNCNNNSIIYDAQRLQCMIVPVSSQYLHLRMSVLESFVHAKL